jgi:hypothetical protein
VHWSEAVDREVEHTKVEENELGQHPAREPLVEELQILLPMPQEHLDQELNSMMAAELEAEQLLRVQEEVLVLEGVGV